MTKILNITVSAADRIRTLPVTAVGQQLKLSIAKSGCSGNRYDLRFVDQAGPADEKVSDNGVDILIEPAALPIIQGMTIDWKEDKFGRQFTFDNPQEAGRCGCGESFHI
jgi:iron-sulfur cluster assembly protein